MKRKAIGILLCTAMMLAGCGGSQTVTEATDEIAEAAVTAEASETDATENTDAADDEAGTDTAAAEEDIFPWAEEQGITFTTEPLSIPCYTYVNDGTNHPDERVNVTQGNASYTVPTVTVSAPDADGNITYSIDQTITIPFEAVVPNEIDYAYNRFIFESLNAMDYYTGTIYPAQSLTDENDHHSYITSEVEWDGVTYQVSVAKTFETEETMNYSYDVDNDNWGWEAEYEISYHIEVVAPEAYDGLIMAINRNGFTEFAELDIEIDDAHVFGSDDEDVSDYIFYRVNDLI